MARMVPPYVPQETKSSGERLIFDLLANDPATKDWAVLHSLCLAKHVKRLYGEIDFVILAPKFGIYCLEVKSGDLKREQGIWTYRNKFGEITTSPRGPFEQAQQGMLTLIDAVKTRYGEQSRLSRLVFGYGVMFPHITFKMEGLEYEDWQIYDRDSRREPVSEYVKRLAGNTQKKLKGCSWFHEVDSLPSKGDVDVLLSFLRGDFERIVRHQDLVSDLENEITQFTAEQYLCLDGLNDNPRCLFQGPAGTGKTMIAIESVRRSLFQKRRVLFVCYNRLLGKMLASQFTATGHDSLSVGSFHSFLAKIASCNLADKATEEDSEEFARFILPLSALEAIDRGDIEPFDKVVVDEGQDLIVPEYLDVISALLKGGLSGGCWEIYADFQRQAIFERLSAPEMLSLLSLRANFTKFKLTVNCRNTKTIAEETAILSGFDAYPSLLSRIIGPPVSYLFFRDSKHQVEKLEESIVGLLKQGVKGENITILSPRRLENSCVFELYTCQLLKSYRVEIEDMSQRYENRLKNPHGGINKIGFCTIQSFKGLENAYIILTDITKIHDEESRSILYVGMSRARIGLVVFISEQVRREYDESIKRGLRKQEA
ncbi:MAG: NERD domain-containing protein [Syntrophorhabdus sp.]|nr:NERD domain-containing protein [Syntrophorhabdus sp.]